MKQLVYLHEMTRPLVVVAGQAVTRLVSSRLSRSLSRLLPGPRGRRIIGWASLVVSLVVQILCLVILSELISLCIDLAELWTLLAQKHLEITLDETS